MCNMRSNPDNSALAYPNLLAGAWQWDWKHALKNSSFLCITGIASRLSCKSQVHGIRCTSDAKVRCQG